MTVPRVTSDAAAIETAMRLSVLLSAGLTAAAAWRHLAQDGSPVIRSAAITAEDGGDVAEALRSEGAPWSDIGAVWAVAVAVGAPLADALRGAAAALRDAAEVRAEVSVALAEPVATARLLTWLPVLALPLGLALGTNPFEALREPLGGCALLIGVCLVGASHAWTRRLAQRAQPPDGIPGWDAELVAVALSSGVSTERARAITDAAYGTGDVESRARVAAVLEISVRTGAPAGELLRGEAWLARHRARTLGRESAARLSTRLLVPLGVCTLRAFLLLAVVPAVLGVARSTVISL